MKSRSRNPLWTVAFAGISMRCTEPDDLTFWKPEGESFVGMESASSDPSRKWENEKALREPQISKRFIRGGHFSDTLAMVASITRDSAPH